MPKLKMYVVDGSLGYFEPWEPLFDLEMDPSKADVFLFTGGADIDPELYGEVNVASHPWPERDAREVPFFHRAVAEKKPMIGICRGAQLICALAGGTLYQHVDNHERAHEMITDDGQRMLVSSLHHQMLRPSGNYQIKAWSNPRSQRYVYANLNGEKTTVTRPQHQHQVDPEVVWYPDIKAYCIQGHPEFMDPLEPAVQYFLSEVQRLIIEG